MPFEALAPVQDVHKGLLLMGSPGHFGAPKWARGGGGTHSTCPQKEPPRHKKPVINTLLFERLLRNVTASGPELS